MDVTPAVVGTPVVAVVGVIAVVPGSCGVRVASRLCLEGVEEGFPLGAEVRNVLARDRRLDAFGNVRTGSVNERLGLDTVRSHERYVRGNRPGVLG